SRLLQQHFGLEQFKLETDRTQFLAQQEVLVLESEAVGGVTGLGRIGRLACKSGLLLCAVEFPRSQFAFLAAAVDTLAHKRSFPCPITHADPGPAATQLKDADA